ncbi:hypothetical protein [Tropicimonas sp.]|uniref:hypothetical protein n=1 Tax=Tropicimonas sp. TaxID=2067044 RepID=UPI003A8A51D2
MGDELKRLLHALAVWLLIAPFLLHSLIASTVMPTGSADGPVLVICTGDGPLEMVLDPATGEPVRKRPDDSAGQCSWANGAVAMDLRPPVAAPAVIGLPTTVGLPPAPFLLVAVRETGLPPSTGPPAVL